MTKTHTQVAAALAVAAIVIAVILAIAPHTTIVAKEVSDEVYGIDVLALTKNATNLPEQKFPAY